MASPTEAVPSSTGAHPLPWGLALAMLLSSLGTSITNVALPALSAAFEAPFQAVQWVVLVYLLAVTVAIVGVGRLGDLMGRRRLLLVGLGLFTLASLAGGAAVSLWQLMAARIVQGLGAAAMMALTTALVSERVSKNRVGRAMGLLGTVSAVGTALGPTLGGLLMGVGGWPAVFWVHVPLGLVALTLVHRGLPPDHPPVKAAGVRFDTLGTVLLAVCLAAYSLAMTVGRGAFGSANVTLLLTAAVGVGAFVVAESRAAVPLVRLAVFRHPVMGTGFASSALVTTVVMATMVVGPFYLAGALGLDAARMGLVMSVGPAVAAGVGAPAGRLVDRLGSPRVGLAGLATLFLGTVVLPVASVTWGVTGYAVSLGLVTAGYATFQAANNTAVMACAAPDQRGLVSGLLNLSRNLGLITGASAMGAVFHHGAWMAGGAMAQGPQWAAGLGLTFGVAAVLVTVAGCLTLWGGWVARNALCKS